MAMHPFFDRCAKPKPSKGAYLLERKAKRKAIEAFEDASKRKVRQRDGNKCRWPGCPHKDVRLEVAHLDDKKMGGDHGLRSDTSNLILLCLLCHQGAESLHSKDKKIEPLTERGTEGPCAFYQRNRETGAWQHVASERVR